MRRDLGTASAGRLRASQRPVDAGLHLGLEHEFVVSSADGVVDFREVIHGLALGQRNLDPADPNAYRLPSGAAVTCDGAEAEIALPPIPIRPGFAFEVAQRAQAERAALVGRLPEGLRLEGCSTHLSVSVPDEPGPALCRRYATTFAPALMLLMDRRDSPGLLIRPRPGRVELGGEFVDGEDLVAAAAFAVGSVIASREALAAGGTRSPVPTELEVRVEPAKERFGWYVDRTAFGGNLYAEGRSAPLKTVSGEKLSAQSHLDHCWEIARRALEDLATLEEVAVARDAVTGARPLPSEKRIESAGRPVANGIPLAPSPYGNALAVRERASFEMAPVMMTWDLVVLLMLDRAHRRRAFAAVPGTHLESFLRDLDLEALDGEFAEYLGRRPRGRRLENRSQALVPGLFDELGPRIALLPPEFDRHGVPGAAIVARPWLATPRRWLPAWRRGSSAASRLGPRVAVTRPADA